MHCNCIWLERVNPAASRLDATAVAPFFQVKMMCNKLMAGLLDVAEDKAEQYLASVGQFNPRLADRNIWAALSQNPA
jgi:hypothetical protein